MKNSKVIYTAIVALVFLLTWVLYMNSSFAKENRLLREELVQKSSLLEKLEAQTSIPETPEEDVQAIPSITYSTYEFNRRLVVDQLEVCLYPGSKAPKIPRTIEPYTVVDVLDSGLLETEDRELWLYVSLPVYDAPMDNKGWIREADTEELTMNNRELVKNSIYLEKGTLIYELDSVDNIPSGKPTELSDGVSGKIKSEDRGYVYIQCGGGWSFWVDKKYIRYPAIDE